MKPLFGRAYVRVRLGARTYTYYCPGARVGDTIEVPPNWYRPWPQRARVISAGRRWWGKVKTARIVETQ